MATTVLLTDDTKTQSNNIYLIINTGHIYYWGFRYKRNLMNMEAYICWKSFVLFHFSKNGYGWKWSWETIHFSYVRLLLRNLKV